MRLIVIAVLAFVVLLSVLVVGIKVEDQRSQKKAQDNLESLKTVARPGAKPGDALGLAAKLGGFAITQYRIEAPEGLLLKVDSATAVIEVWSLNDANLSKMSSIKKGEFELWQPDSLTYLKVSVDDSKITSVTTRTMDGF